MLKLRISEGTVISLDDELVKFIPPEVTASLQDFWTTDPLLSGKVDFSNRKAAERTIEARTAAFVSACGILFSELRKAQGIKQTGAEKISGIKQSYFSRFERGGQDNMTLFSLIACFFAINIKVDVKIAPRDEVVPRPITNTKKIGRYLYLQQANQAGNIYW